MGEHVQRLSVRNEFVIGMDLKAIACTIPARSTKHQRDPQSPAGLHGNLLHAMLAAARSPYCRYRICHLGFFFLGWFPTVPLTDSLKVCRVGYLLLAAGPH